MFNFLIQDAVKYLCYIIMEERGQSVLEAVTKSEMRYESWFFIVDFDLHRNFGIIIRLSETQIILWLA